uniref:RNA polymerase alpha subunit n=1 Tax=Pelargonium trifidum TaxID=122198 RepID=A0A1B0PXR0_9ROSI|nr:RNA polymerase alpha subunit [Pelargonium trifidum]YP_009299958.1 RNA polymerase alpha subunit [Pelargonium trifidum]AJB99831.1 RNA polymerase alpha subunit [Pelargonium trifidum]AJB99873.1 RNA polymerase alpha subunit [Pelargonium trifidum]
MERIQIQYKRIPSGGDYGKFVLCPIHNGQANFLANSLRQALLKSLVCARVTRAKIKNEPTFGMHIQGIKESIPAILRNLSKIRLKGNFDDLHLPCTEKAILDVNIPLKEKEVFAILDRKNCPFTIMAHDIKLPSGLSVVDKTQHIATLTEPVSFCVELQIEINSVDSKTETEVTNEEQGWHSFDVSFLPIHLVTTSIHRYDYAGESVEMLLIGIWTDKTIGAYEALVQASQRTIE